MKNSNFITKLKDERMLAVEYKGSHLANNQDTKEKVLIGELREKYTKGKGNFSAKANSTNVSPPPAARPP